MSASSGHGIPDMDVDDITGQIARVMREPVSDPEAAIQEMRAHMFALAVRTKRIEGVARWLATVIVMSALGVMGTVVTAAYTVGANRARDREQLDEVIRRLDRIDGRAEADVERNDR